MPSLSALLRSLGNDRALGNVRQVLEARAAEDWLVAGLVLRLERRDQAAVLATPSVSTAA
jgi:hypothetical protein